ncbi:hypothetical protein MNBD_ALPHA11-1143 [hydrothermal vent metagenome]|uniref:Enoyl reductase (ER) domain-containing protein n=1 Tax=hydrothermal vent metagenome TaxID=652676 RepID=A0A3B0U6G7_9ZZZZ
MQTVVYNTYGGPEVLQIKETQAPTPKNNEVLIKIYASTVSSGDWRARSLELPPGFGVIGRLVFGVFGPRQPVLGSDLAGEIVEIGKEVTKFGVGDHVIAYASSSFGCHAEFKTMPQNGAIALKPSNLSFEEAAGIPFGGITALEFLKDMGNIQRGESVLVVGASGATGSSAVQLAAYFGAHVSAVCSGANRELVMSLGAEHVIDYQKEDFTKNGKTYDIIIDTTGTSPWQRAKNSLTPTGRLLVVSGSLKDMLQAAFVSRKHGKKLISGVSIGSPEKLKFLVDLAREGNFKPLIDRVYPFERAVKAHAYVDSGRKKGSVVLRIVPESCASHTAHNISQSLFAFSQGKPK